MIHRRGFLAGVSALLFAPAIIRTPGLLMPVKPLPYRFSVWIGVDLATQPSYSACWRLHDHIPVDGEPFLLRTQAHVDWANIYGRSRFTAADIAWGLNESV